MKIAIVASGGGAAGIRQLAWFAAVESVLNELGLSIWRMYGTSAGALNVAGYSWVGLQSLKEFWDSIESESDVLHSYPWIEVPFRSGLKNTDPLHAKVTDIYRRRVHNPIPFTVTSVDRVSRRIGHFDHDDQDILNMVVASATIPILCEPYVPAHAKLPDGSVSEAWIDGGVKENISIAKAVSDGADFIIALYCFPLVEQIPTSAKVGGVIQAIEETVDLAIDEGFKDDMNATGGVPTFAFATLDDSIGVLEFDHRKMGAAYAIAVKEAEAFCEPLKKMLSSWSSRALVQDSEKTAPNSRVP